MPDALDDVLLAKAAIIERCVRRTREEYAAAGNFATDFTHQDAALLNLQRSCEASLDMAQRMVRLRGLGVPQTAREAFELLAQAGVIAPDLADRLERMAGFRNVAVHDYRKLDLSLVEDVIRHKLDDLLSFSRTLLQASAQR